jgi:CAAX protease family protein
MTEGGAAAIDEPGRDGGTTAPKGPWGAFLTLVFTLLIGGGFVLAQLVVAIPYLGASMTEWSVEAFQRAGAALGGDGFFLGLSELVSGTTALALTGFFIWLRRGPRIEEYLALRTARARTILLWIAFTFLVGIGLEVASYVTGHDSVPDWMLQIFASPGSMPLLLFAVVIMGPVAEEVVFRGFLLEGLRHSFLRGTGAVVVAAFLWASIHFQYETFYVGQVFVVGLLLGAARLRTRSILVPIVMHCFFNGISATQLLLQMS